MQILPLKCSLISLPSLCNHLEKNFFLIFLFFGLSSYNMGFPGGSVVKNAPANAGDLRDVGSIPELRRW